MRRWLFTGLVIGLGLLWLNGCGGSGGEKVKQGDVAVPEDLNKSGMVIGVPQGAAAMTAGEKFFDKARIQYFNSLTDGYMAVQQKKIDAFIFDRHSMEYVVKVNPKLVLLPDDIGEEHIVIGAPKRNQKLIGEVNGFIRQYLSDGTQKDMYQRWFGKKQPPMPEIPVPKSPSRKLVVGTEGLNVPMNFFSKDGKVTGFDIEFTRRLALYLNADLEIVTMSFDALIPAVEAGKLDLLIANLNATKERGEKMLMSDDYVDSAISIMVHRDRLGGAVRTADEILSVQDLAGRKVASLTGSAFQQLTEPLVDNVEYMSFNDNVLSVQALRTGKVDAVLFDEPIARLYASTFSEDVQVACIYAEDHYGFACRKGSPLTAKASAVIQELKRSGEMKKLKDKWCGADKGKKVLEKWSHRKDYTGKNGELRFAADPVQEPMCYMGAGEHLIGLELDVMHRIAYDLDMKLTVISMNFGSLIESLISGRADIVGGSMSITEDRKEKVDFVESHYDGGLTILVRKPKSAPRSGAIVNFSQLYGKRLGILTGTNMDRVAQQTFPSSKQVFFNAFADMPTALKSGRIEGFLIEEPQARLLVNKVAGLSVLPKKISSDDYAFLFAPKDKVLCQAFNEQLQKMKKDGTLKKLDEKWFSGNEKEQTMPKQEARPPKGILRFATVPQSEPFSFLRSGQVVGYDIEVAYRIASELGYGLEPVIAEWGGYIEAVTSGKARFGVGCTTVTEERKQQVLFSEPDYQGGVVVVVAAAPAVQEEPGFADRLAAFGKGLKSSFERTFVRESRWKLILDGLKVTVLITVLAAVAGTILAFGVCAMRRAENRLISGLAHAYVALMQGMPILVILMILYYVVFAKVDISAIIVAVIGFAMNFAAYAGEMFRSGINGIPRGQTEAALALGFTRWQAFRKVILPQVLRRILPIYRGEFVSMLKMTSIVGYIAIQDLTKMSDIIRSRTYEAFFPLIVTAVIYFLSAHLLAGMIAWVEYRLDPLNRRTAAKGENI